MDNLQKETQATTWKLFIGTFLLVLFFIVAVKLNIFQSRMIVGKPMPPITAEKWLTEPLVPEEISGKVLFIFFYRDDIETCQKFIDWTKDFQQRFAKKGLLTVAVVSPLGVKEQTLTDLENRFRQAGRGIYAALDEGGRNRRKYRHVSFATYYIADRLGILRFVGNAEKGKKRAEKELQRLLKSPVLPSWT